LQCKITFFVRLHIKKSDSCVPAQAVSVSWTPVSGEGSDASQWDDESKERSEQGERDRLVGF